MYRFEGGICPENVNSYQIQNGWLTAIIDLNTRSIWTTASLKNVNSRKLQMADLRPLFIGP